MSVHDKIASLDVSQPYVWRLKLSEADFNDLETYLTRIATVDGVSALANSKNALTTVVYVAEWYKRCYQGGNRNTLFENLDFETLWKNSGINQGTFLYKDESGNKRWLYSIYVLGGLAIRHELNRNDKMRFLKGLCRIYHGEECTLENLDDASRAIAFRESIKRQHSLYEYMKEILNGEMPFHSDDVVDQNSDVNRFVDTVNAANDEVLKVKFRFEWVVNFTPDYTHMSRRLNIWLKPEEVGGGLHQYLRYDRIHLWGVPNPENQLHLYVFIRFKHDDEVVEPSTMNTPIITYLNHGVNDFVSVGVEKGLTIKHLPTCRFNKIEIVLKDDAGNEYLAQVQETSEYIQLWRVDTFGNTWTSTQNAQKQTALVFSNHCKLKDETIADEVYRKCFRDQQFGNSDIWNWIYIYDHVTFIDDRGKEICLFNRVGYDQVTTKLYTDSIHYIDGGKVKHFYIDDPEISEEVDADELPLIFGKKDIIVRHFATKDDIRDAQPEKDVDAESIEYKQQNGLYALWTNDSSPSYGAVTLRVTVKGKPYIYNVAYLPALTEDIPIKRDFERSYIEYRGVDGKEIVFQDTIPMDGIPLASTISLEYGLDDDYFEVEVYRPTLIKEVMLDDQIIEYLHGDEKLNLPYIFKQRVQLNDFSVYGYQAYECGNLCSIYTQDYLNIANNPSVGMAALAKWATDAKYLGKLLDPMAPDSLMVCFGNAKNTSCWDGQEALVWNYDQGQTPTAIDPKDVPEFGIVFQNLSKNKNLVCNHPIQVDDDPWGFDDVEVSLVKCFEVANEAGTYFFLMKPLVELSKNDIINQVYKPLLVARNGELTENDKQGLLRLGEEFGLDWKANKINI